MMEDNLVYVGTKPVMNYVLAVMTQFNAGAQEVVIRARGKSITRAVDTAEIITRQFLTSAKKKEVTIDTDTVETDAGPANVSTIQIVLSWN
ncbi:MAG TPA: DNA-binding protein Alba [Methanocorpusculum sp.]|nr:DNA-binding protein Alba [Methanocorpusculum sp.]